MATEWLGGLHAVDAVLDQRPQDIISISVVHNRQDQKMANLVGKAQKRGVLVHAVDKAFIEKHLAGQNHQGIAAEVKPMSLRGEADLFAVIKKQQKSGQTQRLMILDGVTDPHNLGAILRSCDATGVTGVLLPKDNSAPINAIVHKVSSGASQTLPIYQITNLSRCIEKLKAEQVWVYGLAGEATQNLYQTQFNGDLALIMGSEGSGLRRLTRESCDFLVSIPMLGQVESLNVSVAAGVLLYEILRQNSVPN